MIFKNLTGQHQCLQWINSLFWKLVRSQVLILPFFIKYNTKSANNMDKFLSIELVQLISEEMIK